MGNWIDIWTGEWIDRRWVIGLIYGPVIGLIDRWVIGLIYGPVNGLIGDG